jgi:hypothetical protein
VNGSELTGTQSPNNPIDSNSAAVVERKRLIPDFVATSIVAIWIVVRALKKSIRNRLTRQPDGRATVTSFQLPWPMRACAEFSSE